MSIQEVAVERSIAENLASKIQPAGGQDRHEPGEACGEYFKGLLPDPQHHIKLEARMENDEMSLAQAILAHLIAALSTDMTVTSFAEEANELISKGVGIPGAKVCSQCGQGFKPKRAGQAYCCSACGSRAVGGSPLMDHSENCMVIGQ